MNSEGLKAQVLLLKQQITELDKQIEEIRQVYGFDDDDNTCHLDDGPTVDERITMLSDKLDALIKRVGEPVTLDDWHAVLAKLETMHGKII